MSAGTRLILWSSSGPLTFEATAHGLVITCDPSSGPFSSARKRLDLHDTQELRQFLAEHFPRAA